MRWRGHQDCERRAKAAVQAEERVSSQAREECPGSFVTKPAGNSSGRPERDHAKTRHQPGMSGNKGNGTQYLRCKFSPALGKRTHELVPCWSVDPQRISCFIEATFQHHRRAVIERMRQRSRRVNPLQAVAFQR